MHRAIRSLSLAAGLTIGIGLAAASAAPTIVNVDGRSGPWDFNNTLNSTFTYGDPQNKDFLPPTLVSIASLGLTAGSDSIGIQYFGGLISAFQGVPPNVNNNGYAYLANPGLKDDAPGNSGGGFPSRYLPGEWGATQLANQVPVPPDPNDVIIADESGVFLGALVFSVLDANGNIISVGSMGTTTTTANSQGGTFGLGFLLPANAAFIGFGINDDIFSDNSGAFQVCVGSAAELDSPNPCANVVATPEPGSLALIATGLLGFAATRRRKRAG